MLSSSITLVAVPGIPHVHAGDDVAALLLDALGRAGLALQDGDVIAIAQKIVSKAEGRQVRLADVTPSARAVELAGQVGKDARLMELILRESVEVSRLRPGVIIARHRYFLNYCCFGYSLPWYHWPQWERLIDWMALQGVNLPLAVTGQEAVWQAVGRRLGLDDTDLGEFLAGPPTAKKATPSAVALAA